MGSDPSSPRRMHTDHDEQADVDTHVTGNVARDGFERLAHRRHPGAPPPENEYGPFAMFGGGEDKTIKPRVGERVYRWPQDDNGD